MIYLMMFLGSVFQSLLANSSTTAAVSNKLGKKKSKMETATESQKIYSFSLLHLGPPRASPHAAARWPCPAAPAAGCPPWGGPRPGFHGCWEPSSGPRPDCSSAPPREAEIAPTQGAISGCTPMGYVPVTGAQNCRLGCPFLQKGCS